MRANDIEVRANDIEKARPVDFRAHPVDFWSVLAGSVKSIAIGVTQHTIKSYDKKPRNKSAKADQKLAF